MHNGQTYNFLDLVRIATIYRVVGLLLGWLALLPPVWAASDPASTAPCSQTCQPTEPPVVRSERAQLCRGERTQLKATGCAGTVIWSTGEQGEAISVTPHQTTRYTAVCRLADGCVSCFAEAYTVTVNTPDAPRVTTETPVICADDRATLMVTNCAGTVQWSDAGLTGTTPRVQVRQTTTYQATCQEKGCTSNPSALLTLHVARPTVPVITRPLGEGVICAGQAVVLSTGYCAGQVRWSDGGIGADRTLMPRQTSQLRAVCRVGTCQSDSSAAIIIRVQPASDTQLARRLVQNTCPFLTADLSQAVGTSFQPTLTYEYRTGPDPEASVVPSPGAVLAGTYYVSARTAAGCLSRPIAVSVVMVPCANGIAPCLSQPPAISLLLDTLDRQRGLVCLSARLLGSAAALIRPDSAWTCSGTGLFTGTATLRPRYVASEADRQRGTVTFTLTTADPDGAGPCRPARANLVVPVWPDKPGSAGDSTQVVSAPPDIPDGNSIFIPEGFSPNGDGINDRFVIRGVPVAATVSLEIVNRWGHRVYADSDYKNDWEGQPNQGIGAASSAGLPDGTYFYVVRISDGREFVRFLTIAR